MNSGDIVQARRSGDRDPVDDADDITMNDGLQSIELHHRSPDGEGAVVLSYEEYTQYRRDPHTPTREVDIHNVDLEGDPEGQAAE